MNKYLRSKPRLLALIIALFLGVSGTANLFAQYPEGAIHGTFSVSDSTYVFFSQGNLQYIGSASTPYWKFADNQWDYFGTSTGQHNSNQNVDRDLFGWGTSGYNHGATCYQPWNTERTNSNYYAYGSSSYHLYDQTGQADWGFNPIINGGNQPNQWRTLTTDEWAYVFNTRTTYSGIRYAKANVNGVNGVILLPDGWSRSIYNLFDTNNGGANYSSNTLSAGIWNTLEQAGAVFLPAAGYRWGSSLLSVGSDGDYWSASYMNNSNAHHVDFSNSTFTPQSGSYRYDGFSVRVVCTAQNVSFGINATPNPTQGGTVSGGGSYTLGTTCTLIAIPAAGYVFNRWTESGIPVSTDATYTFTVIGDRNLLANFIIDGNINFYDAYVKALCVANWDTNGDGELSYVEAASVTSLGDVFKNNTDIHSFNELQYFLSLGSIGEQAFYGCTELTQVTIPEQVTTVDSKAFWNCPALQTVRFNAINCTSMQTTYNSQTYSVFSEDASGSASNVKSVVLGTNVQRIPDYAFKDCVDIYPGLTIRNSVTEIGAHAFENCSSITTLSFQNNSILATIGDYAFKGCSALNRALNLPNSLVTLGQYAFYGCTAIPSLTIGTSTETIGGYAFWNCPALTTVNFNATNCTSMVTNSQYSVFNNGTSNGGTTPIETLTIGTNVTRIPDYAFRNSPGITHPLAIPDATTYIGQYAFYSIQSTELTIGTGVASIGGYAFWNCPNLATVHFNATNCTQMHTQTGSNNNYVYYSVFNSVTSNGGATPIITLTIGENVTIIPDYAFRNSSNMANNLVVPNNVITIGQYAFAGSTGQTRSLLLGNAVTTIGQYAFDGCNGFSGDLVIPNSVTSMGQYAFNNCRGFNGTLTLPTNDLFNIINQYSFNGCSALTGTLTIPANVTEIAHSAFGNCRSFTGALTLHDALTTIGGYAFYGCSNISELTIGEGVATIGEYAFWKCPALATVHFNATNCTSMVTNSQYSVFNSGTSNGGATPIVTLSLGNNVTRIPDYAFRNSTSMTSVISIPNVTTTIGQYAFYGSRSPELTIGEGVATIGEYAFWNCPALATVHFNATNCTSMVTNSQYSVFNSGTSNGGATPIVALTIGNNVTIIPAYAFRYSNNMTSDIILPDAVTSIGTYAFANCSGHDVFTGNNVTDIPDNTFYQSSGFNGTLLFGNALTNIGQYAFQGCSGFTGDLTIPNAVTSLGQYAFQNCTGFYGSLIIGRGVQTIKKYTFDNCSGFSGALILGTQVNSIANNSFQNCNSFALVISENPNPVSATSSSFTGMNYSIPVYVPAGLVPNYQNTTGWSIFTNYIEQFTFWQELDTDNWSDEQNWLSGKLPGENDVVCITYNCDLDIDFDVLYVYVYNVNDVLTIKANQTLYTTYGVGLMSPSQLVIEEGGQVIYGNGANANGTQTLELSSGWNWVSFNVEITMDDLKAAIVAANPGAAPVIKSKGSGQTSYNGAVWVGALRTLDLSQMYEIKVANACTVNLEGTRLNPADHPATIKNGANWIAYPLDEEMSVANAFAGFPVTGDNVKSKDGGQATWNGVMWLGALKNLVPGAGYIYNSKATENKTLTF